MDIVFNDEQVLLRESLSRFLQDKYDFSTRRAIANSDKGFDAEIWARFAQMGLLAAPFSERDGGLGLGPLGVMIVSQECGRRLVVEPYFETIVVVGGLIERAGTVDQREKYLPDIVSGAAKWALAASEDKSRYAFDRIATVAERSSGGYVLRGSKAAVVAAPWADNLLVSAKIPTEAAPAGLGLFVVERATQNLHLKDFRTIDGRRAAEIALDGVFVPDSALLGANSSALPALEQCRDHAIAALCAEAVGAMEELVQLTVEYAKTRKQFGVAIGSFQVLQHRMVDMFIALQEAAAITNLLTVTLARAEGSQAQLASATKAKVGEAARFVGEQAIQIHGGMGMSDELSVGHYFKRLTAINIQFGDATYHAARFGLLSAAA